jgi:hypothetical protein
MREVSSSRTMASPCWLCCENGDLSPNSLQQTNLNRTLLKNPRIGIISNWLTWKKEVKQWGKDRSKSKREIVRTGRRATREGRSAPCQRRGETAQEHWLSSNSASPVSSVFLPFASSPFPLAPDAFGRSKAESRRCSLLSALEC